MLSLTAELMAHAEQGEDGIELNKKLEGAYAEMNKLAKEAQAEHFGNSPASGLDPDNVNHALRHLRLAVFGLLRITRRVSSEEEDAAIAAGVTAVNRAVQKYLVELSSEVSAQGSVANAEPMDRALARLSGSAQSPQTRSHKSVTRSVDSKSKIVSFYKDAYEQIRLATTEHFTMQCSELRNSRSVSCTLLSEIAKRSRAKS